MWFNEKKIKTSWSNQPQQSFHQKSFIKHKSLFKACMPKEDPMSKDMQKGRWNLPRITDTVQIAGLHYHINGGGALQLFFLLRPEEAVSGSLTFTACLYFCSALPDPRRINAFHGHLCLSLSENGLAEQPTTVQLTMLLAPTREKWAGSLVCWFIHLFLSSFFLFVIFAQALLIYNSYDIHLLKFATHALQWKLRKDFLKPVRYGQSWVWSLEPLSG